MQTLFEHATHKIEYSELDGWIYYRGVITMHITELVQILDKYPAKKPDHKCAKCDKMIPASEWVCLSCDMDVSASVLTRPEDSTGDAPTTIRITNQPYDEDKHMEDYMEQKQAYLAKKEGE